ncbi:MAG TPA: hypothetical protein VFV43_00155 [Limnobacter sp.]|nr:hypothetical protein [Limnobacter sp.]
MNLQRRTLLPCLALLLPAFAHTAENDLHYTSVFENYRPYAEPELQNWPKAIETVEEIGGWRVYAREPREGMSPTKEEVPAPPPSHHNHVGDKP